HPLPLRGDELVDLVEGGRVFPGEALAIAHDREGRGRVGPLVPRQPGRLPPRGTARSSPDRSLAAISVLPLSRNDSRVTSRVLPSAKVAITRICWRPPIRSMTGLIGATSIFMTLVDVKSTVAPLAIQARRIW